MSLTMYLAGMEILIMLSRGYEGRYHFQPEFLCLYDIKAGQSKFCTEKYRAACPVFLLGKNLIVHKQIKNVT